MTLRLQILQTAKLAQQQLTDSWESVRSFAQSQYARRDGLSSGAFIDRSGDDDLYYSVFGLECTQLLDLSIDFPQTGKYVRSQLADSELDLIHTTSVCRCLGSLAHIQKIQMDGEIVDTLCQRLEKYRSQDGAYNQIESANSGSAYAAFVVLDAYQSLGRKIPDEQALIDSINSVRCADGSYGFEPGALHGTTPTTVAAILALRECGCELDPAAQQWLRHRYCGLGGFTAGPLTPVPDLLSTACALYALSLYGDHCQDIADSCLDFIDTLWSSKGSFYGHWEEETLDCEYTYYGLLALGALYSGEENGSV